MNKLFAIGLFLPFFLSCNKFSEQEIQLIDPQIKLSGVEILKKSKMGHLLFITDTVILISLPQSSDSLFAIYGLKSNKYLGSLVKRGKGMEEFSSWLFYGQHQTDKTGIKIWITDFHTMEINLINLTASLQSGKTIIEKRVSFANKNIPEPTFLFYMSNDKIGGYHNVINKHIAFNERFFLLNLLSRKVQYKEVPTIKTSDNLNHIFRNRVYAGMARIKPDGGRIVDMKRFQPKVNIVDSNGNHLNSFILERNYPTSFESDILGATSYKVFNNWVDLSNQFIYVLRTEPIHYMPNGSKRRKIISVLDWNGTSINEFIITENIQSFAVDERNKTIYGLASREQKLLKYRY